MSSHDSETMEDVKPAFAELGVPYFDIVGARNGDAQRFYAFEGDRSRVLGPLAEASA